MGKWSHEMNIKRLLGIPFVVLAAAAFADGIGNVRTIVTGQHFECRSSVKTSFLREEFDGTPVQCVLPADLLAASSKEVAIPAGTMLLGWKKQGNVEWTAWTTPARNFVGDEVVHGVAFESSMDTRRDTFTVVALHDIVIPGLDATER
jgi:hypothetical protein